MELRIDGVLVERDVVGCTSSGESLRFKIDLRKDLIKKSHQVSLYALQQNASWHSVGVHTKRLGEIFLSNPSSNLS